ncbi:MAG: hypothetical protein IKK51_05140 [Oscillospiraceae bacterium]|nr:hypothetical protein [Oscillospiraceae bacterium]MBR4101247.1 hypothetical protein [Oscillospiraceae bacterium]
MEASQYSDILLREHPVSEKRQQMSRRSRAAQFAPFAALTGYDDAVSETARLTEQRAVLTEDACAVLDVRMQLLQEHLEERPQIVVTCFVPDEKKEGGAYRNISGRVRWIDFAQQLLVFTDGRRLHLREIFAMEGEIFHFGVAKHRFAQNAI